MSFFNFQAATPYAGTAYENSVNAWDVLEKMRSKHGRQVPFYNLAGNHDYYSGGHGFYQYIVRFNRGFDTGSVQQASYFALQNEDWQLQSLDTGLNDRDLPNVGADTTFLRPDEIAWHQAQIAKAGGEADRGPQSSEGTELSHQEHAKSAS